MSDQLKSRGIVAVKLLKQQQLKALELSQTAVRIDKWYVYKYTEAELDQCIEQYVLDPLLEINIDYPLFVETLKQVLAELGYNRVYNSLYINQFYNFDILNIAENHPDRSAENTFKFEAVEKVETIETRLSLPTHTTSYVWKYIHELPKGKGYKDFKPFYILNTVFRRETEDSTHKIEFLNLDLCKLEVTYEAMCNLLTSLLKKVLPTHELVLRRTRYPYVEPGIEGFVKLDKDSELEILGAGLYSKNILERLGLSPDKNVLGAGIGVARLFLAYCSV